MNLQLLENIDRKLLLAINGSHTDFLDPLMYYLSEKWVMIPVYLLLLFYLQKFFGWKTTGIILLFTIALIALCDLTATHLFKNIVLRYRPSHNMEIKEKLHFVYGYEGGKYGFYSSHASNMTALALFIGYFLRKKIKYYTLAAVILVFLICYSRIYLGVHYPSDIIAGVLSGTFFSLLFIFLYKKILKNNHT